MRYKVDLTGIAEADAYTAYQYLRELAPESADIWLKNLFQAIFSLDEMPTPIPGKAFGDERLALGESCNPN